MPADRKRQGAYMISVVAERYDIHPQTLRLYEREGLLKPSRTDGNTRLYSEEDIERLKTILRFTRDLGVNLAGVGIILNMRDNVIELRQQMVRREREMSEFVNYVNRKLASLGVPDRERFPGTALVRSAPSDLVRPVSAEPGQPAPDPGPRKTPGRGSSS